jgi:hypothetical protein
VFRAKGITLGWPYDPDSNGHRCTMHIHLPPLLRAILDLETPFSVRDPTFAVDLAEKASGNLSVSRENAKCVMDLFRQKMPYAGADTRADAHGGGGGSSMPCSSSSSAISSVEQHQHRSELEQEAYEKRSTKPLRQPAATDVTGSKKRPAAKTQGKAAKARAVTAPRVKDGAESSGPSGSSSESSDSI